MSIATKVVRFLSDLPWEIHKIQNNYRRNNGRTELENIARKVVDQRLEKVSGNDMNLFLDERIPHCLYKWNNGRKVEAVFLE